MRFFWFLTVMLFCANGYTQQVEELRIPGEILVQLAPGVDARQWIKAEVNSRSITAELRLDDCLSARSNIHLLRFTETKSNWLPLVDALRQDDQVLLLQPNYEVRFRNTPNDSDYFRQWDMEIIDAPSAWAVTTGGTTAKGTPIVVAIMDSGFYPQHEDLKDNLWNNPHEIPGDGMDNDNNGYVDDMLGWDYWSNSPNIAPGDHGLSTSAIVGAKGNNGFGVTGVNWDVGLMLFSFSSVADLVKAYEYVIDQRQRFNESGGLEGSFVVATNNSFGQDGIRCTQQPIWGAMFDELGAVGVLSSSGVSNFGYNADLQGDMPADCPSDYLVISCNTDEDDNLYDDSAYGPTSVDIGAPGESSITARPGNTYGAFGGNSAATPHVTGSIALLYASSCENLEESALTDPAGTALFVKNVILQSGDRIVSMENRTVTGRRLNLGNAMAELEASCQNILGPLSLTKLYPNPVQGNLTVEYTTPENGNYQVQLFDVLGRQVYEREEIVGQVGLRRFTLDLTNFPPATYLLRLGRDDDWVTTRVVVF